MNLNSIISLLLFLVALTPFSCKKLDKLTQFNMTYEQDFVVQSSTGINLPFNIASPEMETNSESKFSNEDTRKDLIQEIKLTGLKVTLKSPSDGDLKFLNEVEIFINADGLNEAKIAFKYNIPPTVGKVLNLDVTGTDFKEYIKKDEFTLRMKVKTDEIISKDHELNTLSTFFVDATLVK